MYSYLGILKMKEVFSFIHNEGGFNNISNPE